MDACPGSPSGTRDHFKMRRTRVSALVAGSLYCSATTVLAQSPADVDVKEVVVSGKRGPAPVLHGKPETALSGDALRRTLGGTLGETVSESPGTHNSSFGPGVGLPVIRGMSGTRVKVAVDGIATNDASSASPDHAVTVEPLLMEQVKILRGPETIRYGSGAIGGVVEVADGRIATKRLERPVEGRAELRFGTNGREKAGAVKLRTGQGPLVLTADAFGRERGNITIPGFAIDEAAVREQFGVPVTKNTYGYVGNSDVKTHGGGLGLSYVGSRGWIGIAGGVLANNYGIPTGTHSHGTIGPIPPIDAPVRIDMNSTRVDARGELNSDVRWMRTVRAQAGWIDYRHDELEGARIATTFLSKALEYRVEADHRPVERVTGTVGINVLDRTFSAIGTEAFVPKSDIDALGLYAIERVDLGAVRLEAAYRAENQRIVPSPQQTVFGTTRVFPETTYRPRTISAGASVALSPSARGTFTWSRPERAPDVVELYSLGPHLATNTFDLGQPNLRTESMNRWDLGFQSDWSRIALSANYFRYNATDYIYARNTGLFYRIDIASIRPTCIRLEECLPVIQYAQQDANFKGFEAEVVVRVPEAPFAPVNVTFFTDAVSGSFTSGGDVPRLPPRRVGVEGTMFASDNTTVRLRWTHAYPQDRPGENETPTAGYDLVNLFFDYKFDAFAGQESVVYVQLRNLLDEEIRNSTSFLRSFSPEPGRRLDIGVRIAF